MSSSIDLKDFQWSSVDAVLKGLNNGNGVYALADEVGLGKTLVCAETGLQLISRQSNRRHHTIIYVAPAIELLDQNLQTITRYLRARTNGYYRVHFRKSRLSRYSLDLAEAQSSVANGESESSPCISIIGLSPNTSFNVRGQGEFNERIYLAAIMGYSKEQANKDLINRFFWCLNVEFDKKYVSERVQKWSTAAKLNQLTQFTSSKEGIELFNKIKEFKIPERPNTLQRNLIRDVRAAIVEFLINQLNSDLVIFDEWHKYKQTCFENKNLKMLLTKTKKSKTTNVLFVSATPFSVDYKEETDGDTRPLESEDLHGLLQMSCSEEMLSQKYDQLMEKQSQFIKSIIATPTTADIHDKRIDQARKQYQDVLRSYCVRTERPRHEQLQAKVNHSWDAAQESLKSFVNKFAPKKQVRSPITAMWMDGHTFPEFGYDGLKQHSVKNVPDLHWKIESFKTIVEQAYKFDDGLHSFTRPPLWLPCSGKIRNRKFLVFTEFKFVPDEICQIMSSSKIGFGRTPKNVSGNILGSFPLRGTKGTADGANKNVHFPLFYPFLVFEKKDWQSRILKKQSDIQILINQSTDILTLIFSIEELLADPAEIERIQCRKKNLSLRTIPLTKRRRDIFKYLFLSPRPTGTPGQAIARALGEAGILDSIEKISKSKDFKKQLTVLERDIMSAAAHFQRLFSSPEAQHLAGRAKIPKLKDITKNWNHYARFAIWYSQQFGLYEMLGDYFEVLKRSRFNLLDIPGELVASMSLRKGAVGNRYIRSFHDRKISDDEGQQDDRNESTVSLKSIRSGFNSPFAPYILVSTSVGQEGLDFHRYCASLVHWSPPSSPSILRQREGRLDRFQSLQNRIAEQALPAEKRMNLNSLQGLSPDFVVLQDGERINKAANHVFYLPYTAQDATWRRCRQRLFYNDLLIGAPDPLSQEQSILSSVEKLTPEEQREKFLNMKKYSINLAPEPLSQAEIQRLRDKPKRSRS